jgi:predicted neuraminidase
VVKLENKKLVLIFNPDDKNWGARSPLSLAVSNDDGESWDPVIEIQQGNEDDEFSYPSVISFGDTVAVTYTWQRERIAFWMGKVGI